MDGWTGRSAAPGSLPEPEKHPQKVRVIVNTRAGKLQGDSEPEADKLNRAFRNAGLQPDFFLVEPPELEEVLERAAKEKWQSVVIGGGDGTVNTAARILAGSETSLAIIPLGTFNYFARFLNLPFEIQDLATMISQDHKEDFDAVEVNGRLFISHASIGIFPRYIMERLLLQQRRKWAKLPAMVLGLFKSLIQFPVLRITLETDQGAATICSPFLLIGNNSDMISPLFLREDTRTGLQDGKFSIFLSRHASRRRTAWSISKALFGRINLEKDFLKLSLTECEVRTSQKTQLVTLDGELVRLREPLKFRILPQALHLFTRA